MSLRCEVLPLGRVLWLGGFMARGAENQLRLVNVPGIPTLGDESVGRWDGRKRFFPEGFNVGGHL